MFYFAFSSCSVEKQHISRLKLKQQKKVFNCSIWLPLVAFVALRALWDMIEKRTSKCVQALFDVHTTVNRSSCVVFTRRNHFVADYIRGKCGDWERTTFTCHRFLFLLRFARGFADFFVIFELQIMWGIHHDLFRLIECVLSFSKSSYFIPPPFF